MTFFDCTADFAGQLNGNGQQGMLQIDAPYPLAPVENFWLRHCRPLLLNIGADFHRAMATHRAPPCEELDPAIIFFSLVH